MINLFSTMISDIKKCLDLNDALLFFILACLFPLCAIYLNGSYQYGYLVLFCKIVLVIAHIYVIFSLGAIICASGSYYVVVMYQTFILSILLFCNSYPNLLILAVIFGYFSLSYIFLATSREWGGIENVLSFMAAIVLGHTKDELSIKSVFLIYRAFITCRDIGTFHKNNKGKVCPHKISVAFLLFIALIVKEIFVRYSMLFVLFTCYQYSYLAGFFVLHVIGYIYICMALLAINASAVYFISRYFSFHVFGWLGCYQNLNISPRKINGSTIIEFRPSQNKLTIGESLKNHK